MIYLPYDDVCKYRLLAELYVERYDVLQTMKGLSLINDEDVHNYYDEMFNLYHQLTDRIIALEN